MPSLVETLPVDPSRQRASSVELRWSNAHLSTEEAGQLIHSGRCAFFLTVLYACGPTFGTSMVLMQAAPRTPFLLYVLSINSTM